MKAISIRQPWATLMAEGFKRIETRDWQTSHRGELLIHAAKTLTVDGSDLWKREQNSGSIPKSLGPFATLPTGAALCVVDVIDCVQMDWLLNSHEDKASAYRFEYFTDNGSANGEERYGDYRSGRWAWLTRNRRSIKRTIVRGQPAIFDVQLAVP